MANDADRNYRGRVLEGELLIAMLQDALAKHNQEQAKRPRDWGYSGDLSYVNQHLRDLITFLGGDPDSADAAFGMSPAVTAAAEPHNG